MFVHQYIINRCTWETLL